MTNEAYVFNETNRERAILKRSVCHKKGGSKSKSCKLGVDKMSQNQIEAMHGPVKSWKMTEFYTWDEFKSMPKDIQVEYLNYLVDTYHVSVGAIESNLFHLGGGCVYKYLKRNKLSSRVHHSGMRGRSALSYVDAFRKTVNDAKEPKVEEDVVETESETEASSDDIISYPYEPEPTLETMEFSTEYIAFGVDYKSLEAVEKMFSGRKIRVSITLEIV